MRAFKFRLERVLDVKEILEKRAKEEWANQEQLAQQERVELQRLHQHKKDIQDYGYQQSDIKTRQEMYAYLEVLTERIERQKLKLTKAEELAAEMKQQWLLAHQETKKVLKLKDNEYAEFLKEELRKEQKELDDMRSHLQG